MEYHGTLTILPANTPDHDFIVSIRNIKDIGYNPDNPDTRNGTALLALKEQCPTGRVVGETVINTGTFGLGQPARTYAIRVKC